MKFVEFAAFTDTGVRKMGRIVWGKGKFSIEGRDRDILEKVLNDSIRDLRKKGFPELTKRDGLRFLEALPYFYTGGRLCAAEVKEEEEGNDCPCCKKREKEGESI